MGGQRAHQSPPKPILAHTLPHSLDLQSEVEGELWGATVVGTEERSGCLRDEGLTVVRNWEELFWL